MIKKLLAKTTKNTYEIHCIKIDDLHNDQSVVGSISGGGKRGSTYTLHNTVVNANNRLYQDVKKNGSYPFKVGDKMAFICSEQKNGICKIDSLINFTNNSNAITNKFFTYLIACPATWFLGLGLAGLTAFIVSFPAQASRGDSLVAWISVGLALCVILAYLAFFFWLPYYLYRDYQNHKRAVRVLETLRSKKTEEEIKNCLASYGNKSVVSENFFSTEPTESKIE